VPAAELAERTVEVAELFAAMPTRAVWETKRLLDASEDTTLQQQLEGEALTQSELAKTHDFSEGVAAFREKRPASFTGVAPQRLHPVQLVVRDDLRRWRLTVLLRWLLALPLLIVLEGWAYVAFPVAIVNWVITLVRGHSPRGLHEWFARLLRFSTHVYAYMYLIADSYPSFRGWYGTYAIDLDVASPKPQSRWKTFFRLPLAIPAFVLGYVLQLVMIVVSVIGLFAALATGRMPKGMRDLMAYCLRYNAQTIAYLLLLTDRYPTLASGSGFQFEEG
jgi:hypothetical protein